jgi:hypothetical protein
MIDKRLIGQVRWKSFFGGVVLLLVGSLSVAKAGTIAAASCNYSDVLSAYKSAKSGDTVAIPSGSATWSNTLTISKSLTLQGAGSGSTVINRGSGFSNAFVTISGLPSDVPVRVTGIKFNAVTIGQNGPLPTILIFNIAGNPFGFTKIRIDHCYFRYGEQVIFWRNRVYGVVDHCTFYDCIYASILYADGNYAWSRPGINNYGTADSVFFEDNTFIVDANVSFFDCLIDHDFGGKSVIRHNTFDLSAYTSGEFGSLITLHGNQAYYRGNINTDNFRGSIMCEIYNNTFNIYQGYRIIWPRGGRILVANNVFTSTVGSFPLVSMSEEEGGQQPQWFNPTRTTWPAEDQVNNSFFYGNTLNGSAQKASLFKCWDSASTTFIQQNRDYWLQPPDSTTVTNYPHPGDPSLPSYHFSYNPSVTSYTPYAYPHPLVGSADGGSNQVSSNGSSRVVSYSSPPVVGHSSRVRSSYSERSLQKCSSTKRVYSRGLPSDDQ